MDPNTAEILAMDTNIRYDLNDPSNRIILYGTQEQAAMDEKDKGHAWYKMWRNFCVSITFRPRIPAEGITQVMVR